MRFFILLCFCSLVSLCMTAQNKRLMLFENYTKGVVLMKNKSKLNAELNFDAGNGNIMFKQGKNEMILTNPAQTDTIYIGERKFVFMNEAFLEVVSVSSGSILIHWNLKNVYQGKKGAYGRTTQAKVEAINTAEFQYGAYENQYVDVYQLSNRNEYFICKDDNIVIIKSSKTLLKAFPQQEASIREYMTEHHTDFSDTNSVVALLEYCMSL